jgi:hypothetical protein
VRPACRGRTQSLELRPPPRQVSSPPKAVRLVRLNQVWLGLDWDGLWLGLDQATWSIVTAVLALIVKVTRRNSRSATRFCWLFWILGDNKDSDQQILKVLEFTTDFHRTHGMMDGKL